MPDPVTPRYLLPGRTAGVDDPRLYLRSLWGAALWLGLAPLALHVAGAAGARSAIHPLLGWWGRGLARHLQLRLDIEGVEWIEPGERYVVAPLHESLADLLALLHLPLPMRFVGRDELFRWRLVGPYLRRTGQIEICPEQGIASARALLRAAGAVFEAGESLLIFPQGTILGIETEFHRGAFAVARAHGRPLLPVVLTGGHRVWEHPYSPRLRYGERMSLRVLEPVPAERLQAPRGDEAVRREVQRRLKEVALAGEVAPPRRFVPARDGYWDGFEYRIDPAFPALAADVARHRAAQRAD